MQPDFKQPEIEYTNLHKVGCNGGGGALGHPLTYYVMNAEGYAECSYCDKKFIYQAS
ncbi:MAG: putative Zn-finger protein [Alphaproteobacteria bacterium]|jgi:uncharacterized Zn-finger protein